MTVLLFTTAELESYMGVATIDAAAATLAHDLAVGRIQEEAPRALGPAQSRTVILPIVKDAVRLPHRPVTSVTSVSWIVGDGTTVNATYWAFDGIDSISNLDHSWWVYSQTGAYHYLPAPETVQVTYVGGVVTPSAGVKAIGLALAARLIANPPNGLKSETVGSYSYTTSGDGGADFTPDERRTLRRYRAGVLSSRLQQ